MSHTLTDLREVFGAFLKLGLSAYGGPAAHIALMEEEFVERRKWIPRKHFLDLLAATNLIPGPNSTEMALHIGHERCGFLGMLAAGFAFLTPAIVAVSALAFVYQEYGTLPAIQPLLSGIKPAILVLIAVAGLRLGKKAIKSKIHSAIAVLVFCASLAGLSELWCLGLAAFIGIAIRYSSNLKASLILSLGFFCSSLLFALDVWASSPGQTTSSLSSPTPAEFAPVFLKIGAVLYGSGYVLIAFLRTDFVVNQHWISEAQLLDAVAAGQLTPGPVLSTAAFVGYLLSGLPGALIASGAIFLPSFLFVSVLNPLIPRMRRSPLLGSILDAVSVAAVSLIASVAVGLAVQTVTSPTEAALVLVCAFVCLRTKIGAPWMIAGSAVAGYALSSLLS